jgi:hypothetical protein
MYWSSNKANSKVNLSPNSFPFVRSVNSVAWLPNNGPAGPPCGADNTMGKSPFNRDKMHELGSCTSSVEGRTNLTPSVLDMNTIGIKIAFKNLANENHGFLN